MSGSVSRPPCRPALKDQRSTSNRGSSPLSSLLRSPLSVSLSSSRRDRFISSSPRAQRNFSLSLSAPVDPLRPVPSSRPPPPSSCRFSPGGTRTAIRSTPAPCNLTADNVDHTKRAARPRAVEVLTIRAEWPYADFRSPSSPHSRHRNPDRSAFASCLRDLRGRRSGANDTIALSINAE